jgi:hypothetical protein
MKRQRKEFVASFLKRVRVLPSLGEAHPAEHWSTTDGQERDGGGLTTFGADGVSAGMMFHRVHRAFGSARQTVPRSIEESLFQKEVLLVHSE